jgi:hypothetical protein
MASKPARATTKNNGRKKLTLKKVTLRNLEPRDAAAIKGGSYSQRSAPPQSVGGPRCT